MEEKNSSVKLSTRSWHYRLVRLILGNAAPTPQNMFNLCPYFWLLIFSILVSPVVLPIKGIFYVMNSLSDVMTDAMDRYIISPNLKKWYNELEDYKTLKYLNIYGDGKKLSRKQLEKLGLNHSSDIAFRRYQIDTGKSPWKEESYGWTEEFEDWVDRMRMKRVEKAEERIAAWRRTEDRFENTVDWVDLGIRRVSSTVSSWKYIVKWTKRFVGLVVTLLGLAATYYAVNLISRGVLWMVDVMTLKDLVTALIILGAAVAIILLVYLIGEWAKHMKQHGTRLWYVRVLYYVSLYLIYYPAKIVLWDVTWRLLLVNLGLFLAAAGTATWRFITGFLGIFGEYFGASYTDYCPGIEWEEEE